MSSKLKVAVLGVGSLGKEHARIYSELATAGKINFVGIYDHHAETAAKISEKLKVRAFASIPEISRAADAFSIVTPTTTHFELAKPLLAQGKHLLVEKPMTNDVAHAAELIHIAQEKKC